MKIDKIILVFIFAFILTFNMVLAQDWFSGWKNLDITLPEFFTHENTAESIADWLVNFGIPKTISVNWGAIIFFILIPTITFLLVLKAILVDEIIVKTMGINAFADWKGWMFPLLIIIFLIPTGILGRFAMWLYAAAGILTVYGFAALLIVGVADRLLMGTKGGFAISLIIAVVVGALFTFILPAFGFIIGILAVFMTVTGYISRRGRVSPVSPFHQLHRDVDNLQMSINRVKKHPEFKKLQAEQQSNLIQHMKDALTDLSASGCTYDEARQRINAEIDIMRGTTHLHIPHV